MKEANETLLLDVAKLRQDSETQASEIANLRGRASLSQQNWIKERDELVHREAFAREEFENAKQAMQDWEVLAMDERSLRESLTDRVTELEEQLSSQREAYERAASERDTQNLTVDGLQRALQEVQNGVMLFFYLDPDIRLTCFMQPEEQNDGNWSNKRSLSSTSFASSYKPRRQRLTFQEQHLRHRKRSLSEHCRLRKKSKKRTFSLENSGMKLSH